MNEVKKLTMRNRIRKAWHMLTGKPRDSIEIGLQVKRCDECDRGKCESCGYKAHSDGVSKLHDCNDCGREKTCEYTPVPGDWTRINCPLWEQEAEQDEV